MQTETLLLSFRQPVNVVMKSVVVFCFYWGGLIDFVFIIQKLWVQMFKDAVLAEKVIGNSKWDMISKPNII